MTSYFLQFAFTFQPINGTAKDVIAYIKSGIWITPSICREYGSGCGDEVDMDAIQEVLELIEDVILEPYLPSERECVYCASNEEGFPELMCEAFHSWIVFRDPTNELGFTCAQWCNKALPTSFSGCAYYVCLDGWDCLPSHEAIFELRKQFGRGNE